MSVINTIDWFSQWAERTPEKIAIHQFENKVSYSYGRLNAAANALAGFLSLEHQLKKGDHIAVLAENNVLQVVLLAVAQKMGIVLVPLNFRLSGKELGYIINDAECRMLLGDEEKLLLPETGKVISRLSFESLNHFLNEDGSYNPKYIPDENDAVLILYTSGTTGFPKGVMYTHKMMFWNSINTEISLHITGNTRTLNCMPLFHTGGWNVLLTPVLHHGGTVILFRKFDAESILRCIEEEHLDLFMAVPTMLKMLAEQPFFNSSDLSSLKYLIVGGEPMPLDLIRIYHNKGIPVRQGYGLTEAGPNLTSLHQDFAEIKRGSIGKPNFYVSVTITDENGNEVGAGIPGELWVNGPMVMPGYWNKPEESNACMHHNRINTGDIARIDKDGFIYIVDRKKNMFISGGENVYPVQVEKVISEMEQIDEIVILGVPDSRWGEVGVAVFSGDRSLTLEQVIDFCRDKLAKFKVPKYLVYLKEIPRSDTGKLDRKSLKCKISDLIVASKIQMDNT